MEDRRFDQFFLDPQDTFHRRYEALRALFVEKLSLAEVAQRFGYKVSTLKSMASRFRGDVRQGVTPPFFSPTAADDLPGPVVAPINRAPNNLKSPTAAN
jgi:hypothetical protein